VQAKINRTRRSKAPRRSRTRLTSAKTRSQIGGERWATTVSDNDDDDADDDKDEDDEDLMW
jgi:hypothetical protein